MFGFWKRCFFFFLSAIFCFSYLLPAQEIRNSKQVSFASPWQVGVQVGPDFYYGDLNKYKMGIARSINFAGGFYANRQLSNVFGVRGQFLAGGLNGRKEKLDTVRQFSGTFLEFNVNGTLNFSNLFSAYKPSRHFFVYGTLGIGLTNWNTLMESSIDELVFSIVPNPRRWRTSAVIPFGLGAIYKLNDKLNLNVEWTFRLVTSDLLDQERAGFIFDFYDYLAIGVSLNLGKWMKKSQNLLDYPYYPVPDRPQEPVQPRYPEPQKNVFYPENDNYVYVVQIFAFEKTNYSPTWIKKRYKISQPVVREREGKMSRYIIGSFTDIGKAIELRDQVLKKGIHDAFIVAYKDGVRHHTVTSVNGSF